MEDPAEALTSDQGQVLEIFSRRLQPGAHRATNVLFLTGGAGTGKSYLIDQICGLYRHPVLTATTGTAAVHLGGQTLLSFMGMQLARGDVSRHIARFLACKRTLGNRNQSYMHALVQRWMDMDLLVVDEISMAKPYVIFKLDKLLRAIRGVDAPFGGTTVLFCGDFAQLPPVVTAAARESGDAEEGDDRFLFQTPEWKEWDVAVLQLTECVRQRGDHLYAELLARARFGQLTDDDVELLETRTDVELQDVPDSMCVPVLRAYRADVDRVNLTEVQKLDMKQSMTFYARRGIAKTKGGNSIFPLTRHDMPVPRSQYSEAVRSTTAMLSECPARPTECLAVGATVVLLANIDPAARLVNGSIGVVTGFQNPRTLEVVKSPAVGANYQSWSPVVQFFGGPSHPVPVPKHEWRRTTKVQVASGPIDVEIIVNQVPLGLAWALTIHKSQGMSYSAVDMELGTRPMAYGQAYVALSRVESLHGLRLSGRFSPRCIRASPAVVAFYTNAPSLDSFLVQSPATSRKRAASPVDVVRSSKKL